MNRSNRTPILRATRLAATLLAGSLAIAACAATTSPSPAPSGPPTTASPIASEPAPPASSGSAVALPGTGWRVTGFAGTTGVATAILPGTTVTLAFEANGAAGGTGGCNRYSGTYTLDAAAGTLAFGPLMQTEMACSPDATMTQEAGYLAALARAGAYRITGANLQLLDAAGSVVVEAEPAPTS